MRTRSAARIQGDDYQHLIAWRQVVGSIQCGSDVTSVEIEAPEAGSVDDLVVRRAVRPNDYCQIKWAVDARTPVSTDWLTNIRRQGATSILQKLWASWKQLHEEYESPPRLRLVTNRNIDPDDDAFQAFDQYRQTLAGMRAAPSGSRIGRARRQWADHLGVSEDELLQMLENLHFQCGRGLLSEIAAAQYAMAAVGLRNDEEALTLGIGTVREWVKGGTVRLSLAEIESQIGRLDLQRRDPGALLVVEAIDHDPHPEDGAVSLDWREFFPGDRPAERTGAHPPESWGDAMWPQLEGAREEMRQRDASRVHVRATTRLPSWFAIGAAFREVAGFEVSTTRGGAIYASSGNSGKQYVKVSDVVTLKDGNEMAVVVAVSDDPGGEPVSYLQSQDLPVGKLFRLTPQAGPDAGTITGPADANGYSFAIRNAVRQLIREEQPPKLHLFLILPNFLALILGHRWNRMRPTQLYEHLGVGRGYQPAFLIPA